MLAIKRVAVRRVWCAGIAPPFIPVGRKQSAAPECEVCDVTHFIIILCGYVVKSQHLLLSGTVGWGDASIANCTEKMHGKRFSTIKVAVSKSDLNWVRIG